MKFEDYQSGTYKRQYEYESFSPTPVNHVWTWDDPKISTLLEDATRALGELNAFSLIVPDIDLFIRMHVLKEANTSSRIEGTKTGIDEDLMKKEQVAPEKQDDWEEVQNYAEAMNTAIQSLEKLPLSNRLLRSTHAILLQGVRGEHKCPGEFRISQNWIGGATLRDAVFIPPHAQEVPELMSDLEMFWHNTDIDVPHLIRIAISHYQLETIHPFLDGNGRIGRLLITLYLAGKGLLNKPSLYLSDHFEKNKGHYFDALTAVRVSNDLSHWIKFFLVAVLETANKGKQTFSDILELRRQSESAVMSLGQKNVNAQKLLIYLFRYPIITVRDAIDSLGVTRPTANALIDDFVRLKILKQSGGNIRYRFFSFSKYLRLFIG